MLQPTQPSYKVGQYELIPIPETLNLNDIVPFSNIPDNIKEHITPEDMQLSVVNTFILKTPEGIYLFDTGYKEALPERLKTIGINTKEIKKVFITHMHPPHIGSLIRIGAPLFDSAQLTISKPEFDYWTNKELEKLTPAVFQDTFRLAQQIFVRYRKRLELILPMAIHEPFGDGVEPVEAYGHTVGHTAYLISSEGEQLLILGDLILSPGIQFPYPEVPSCFDNNDLKAVRNRKRILNYAAQHNVLIAGMHMPAVGRVVRDDTTDGYIFTPEK